MSNSLAHDPETVGSNPTSAKIFLNLDQKKKKNNHLYIKSIEWI